MSPTTLGSKRASRRWTYASTPDKSAALRDRQVIATVLESGHALAVLDVNDDAPGDRPVVRLFWYDGGKRIESVLLDGAAMAKSGVLVIGDKGNLYAPGDYCENGFKLLGGATEPKVDFPMAPPGGHFAEFVRAIQGGEPAMSNFPDYSAPLTETILLGNLAVWAAPDAGTKGKKIEWDAKNIVATNAPEVMNVVNAAYRRGYEL